MNIFKPGESDAQLQKPSNGRSLPGERHLSSDLFDNPHEAQTKKNQKRTFAQPLQGFPRSDQMKAK